MGPDEGGIFPRAFIQIAFVLNKQGALPSDRMTKVLVFDEGRQDTCDHRSFVYVRVYFQDRIIRKFHVGPAIRDDRCLSISQLP